MLSFAIVYVFESRLFNELQAIEIKASLPFQAPRQIPPVRPTLVPSQVAANRHAACRAEIGIARIPLLENNLSALIAPAVGLDGMGPATAKGGVLAGLTGYPRGSAQRRTGKRATTA